MGGGILFSCFKEGVGDGKGIRKKKVPPLMARPLRPYPPPLELNGHRNFFFVLK